MTGYQYCHLIKISFLRWSLNIWNLTTSTSTSFSSTSFCIGICGEISEFWCWAVEEATRVRVVVHVHYFFVFRKRKWAKEEWEKEERGMEKGFWVRANLYPNDFGEEASLSTLCFFWLIVKVPLFAHCNKSAPERDSCNSKANHFSYSSNRM